MRRTRTYIAHCGHRAAAWLSPGSGFGVLRNVCVPLCVALWMWSLVGCIREPELHLFDAGNVVIEVPLVDLDFETYWDYELGYDVHYDWRSHWFYGWDGIDSTLFGPIGYVRPEVFNLRRYYLGDQPSVPHTRVRSDLVRGSTYRGDYEWGYWDILVWNDIQTMDGVQSLNFDETSTLDTVTAYTNQSMRAARYQAPRYTRAFYEPEALFSAYDRNIEINRNLDGFEFDSLRNAWVKKLDMLLEPVTYIYLTQVILHHNHNRVIGVDGSADFSGVARTVNVNTGVSGQTPVTVYYNVRLKNNCDMRGENVDIIGGRLLTFGICGQNGNRIRRYEDVRDANRHFMDVNMQFNNGMDSTFVFDITDQVRRLWKGGVITVELDVDSIRFPTRKGGSAFDAVVQDYEDGGTPEFEM